LYYLRNKRRPNTNFIRAEITGSAYFLYYVQNEPDDGLGCPGTWLFETAWEYFARNQVTINGIRGSWTFGTNLVSVNALTGKHPMPLADAAKRTWAYARASGKGFPNVQVLDADGTPGHYLSVDVVFVP
jgi:hypothetical protein